MRKHFSRTSRTVLGPGELTNRSISEEVIVSVQYPSTGDGKSGLTVGEFSIEWASDLHDRQIPVLCASVYGGWTALRLCADAIDALSVYVQTIPNVQASLPTPDDVCRILRQIGYEESSYDS